MHRAIRIGSLALCLSVLLGASILLLIQKIGLGSSLAVLGFALVCLRSELYSYLDRRAARIQFANQRDSQRIIIASLDRVASKSREMLDQSRSLGEFGKTTQHALTEIRSAQRTETVRSEQVYRRTVRLTTAVEELPGDVAALNQYWKHLMDGESCAFDVPRVGGWAACARTVAFIGELISRSSHGLTVVECGSGASTVWNAMALRRRGIKSFVYALESSKEYALRTQQEIERRDLSRWARVEWCPLESISLEGRVFPWYGIGDGLLAEIGTIDILFVDGPPGDGASHARLPALQVMARNLRSGSWIVLDDTNRPDEREILSLWSESCPGGFAEERELGRATAIRLGEWTN